MKCKTCDVLLTDEESVFKDPTTGKYADECSFCYEQGIIDIDELYSDDNSFNIDYEE